MLLSAAPTSISVIAQHSNLTYGQSDAFVATVTSSAGPVTDGTVTFFDGSTPLGTRAVNRGTAILTTTDLPAGTNVITVAYNGSSNFLASTLPLGPSSIITTVAGDGGFGFSGDNVPAADTSLSFPEGVAVDRFGNLYIADTGNHVVREVDAKTHVITTIAGNGIDGYSGDDGLATSASLSGPTNIAVDSNGNVFIVDYGNNRIREVNAKTHLITTVAGTGEFTFSGNGGLAKDAGLASPTDVAVDSAGNLFIVDQGNNMIREVNATSHIITTVAGTGNRGFAGDNGPATSASLASPFSIAVDSAGNLFIGDNRNNRIRKVDAATQVITTVAGNGDNAFSGDNGIATDASLALPTGVEVDSAGNLFIAEFGSNHVREVNAVTHVITTVAGDGNRGFLGDNGPAVNARITQPVGVAADGAGNLFIVDTINNRIREVVSSGAARVNVAKASSTTVTHGVGPFTFDGLPHSGGFGTVTGAGGLNTTATTITFSANPDGTGIADLTDAGIYYVTAHYAGDSNHNASDGAAVPIMIQASTSTSVVVSSTTLTFGQEERLTATVTSDFGTVTGGTVNFYNGSTLIGSADVQNGIATLTTATLPAGNYLIQALYLGNEKFVASTSSQTSTSTITTVAGNGNFGFTGDESAAIAASLNLPGTVAVDAVGNLFIVDTANHRIRMVNAATHVITTVAGNGVSSFSGDGGLATDAALSSPSSIAIDATGNLYIADTGNNRIRKVDATTHVITTVAGNGSYGAAGDADIATNALLAFPTGIAVDAAGNLLIADTGNNRIRSVDARTHLITTVVGNGNYGFSGDRGPATAAQLAYPVGIVIDSVGNLLIVDQDNNRIRKVDASTHRITTIAGNRNGGFSGDHLPPTETSLDHPTGIALDAGGNLFITDSGNNRIRQIDPKTNLMTTIAGDGSVGFSGDSGLPSSAALSSPGGIAADPNGNLFIADTFNNRIREVTFSAGLNVTVTKAPTTTTTIGAGPFVYNGTPQVGGSGVVTGAGGLNTVPSFFTYSTKADGIGNADPTLPGSYFVTAHYAGDANHLPSDGASVPFTIISPTSMSLSTDHATLVYGQAETITATLSSTIGSVNEGTVTFYLGATSLGTVPVSNGTASVTTSFSAGVALLSASYSGTDKFLATTTATGHLTTITTVAGKGVAGVSGFSGDNAFATDALLNGPFGIAVDSAGNIFICDTLNQRIRRVDAITQVITTVAGNGVYGFSGDSGPATAARLGNPAGIAVDAAGNLFIVDQDNLRIRKVDAKTGVITTVAGNGSYGFFGDGIPATASGLTHPEGIAVDAGGNLFIADLENSRIRKVSAATGLISTVAGTSSLFGGLGDGGPATSATFFNPARVIVDSLGNLFIIDYSRNRIREVNAATQVINTVAGDGGRGFRGDNKPATNAEFRDPAGVAIDSAGNLFIVDSGNNRIRKVDATTHVITTVVGTGDTGLSGDGGAAQNAALNVPFAIAVDAAGNLYIADTGNNRIRKVTNAPGLVVEKAPSTTTTIGAGSFTYDGHPHAAGAGTVSGIDLTSNAVTLTYSANPDGTGVADLTNAGTYYVTAHYAGDANHLPSDGDPVAITINPATLTITASFNTKVYDGTTTATAIPAVAGLIGSDTIAGLSEAYDSKDVLGIGASQVLVQPGYTINDSHGGLNYTVTFVNSTGTITPATITVSAVSYIKVYDGTTSASPVPMGLFGTDTFVDFTETFASKNALGEDKSVLQLNPGFSINDGNGGKDYQIKLGTMTARGTIVPARLQIQAHPASKTYDGTIEANVAPDVLGLMSPDAVTAVERFDSKNVGEPDSSPISITSYRVSDGNQGRNYFVTTVPGLGTISPATMTISAKPTTKTYDGTTSTSAVPTVTGLKKGDSVTGLSETYESRNALGTAQSLLIVNSGYTVNDGNSGKNYVIGINTAAGTIRPAVLTISATVDSKLYDGTTTSVAIPTATGLVSDDTVFGLSQSYRSKNVLGDGKSSLNVNGGFTISDGNDGRNYSVRRIAAAGTITPASLRIEARFLSKTYDGTTNANILPNFYGLIDTDTATAVERFDSKDAGDPDFTPISIASYRINDGNRGQNYIVTTTPSYGLITPATLTISARSVTKNYDGTTATSSLPTVTGLKGTDTVTELSESFQSRNALGTAQSLLVVNSGFTVNDGNGGKDYVINFNTAAGTIRPATLTITALTDSKVYDGTTSSVAIPTVSGLVDSDAVFGLSQSFGSRNVMGEGKSTLRVNGDFTISDGNEGRNYVVRRVNAQGTITPASLTITATTNTKTYDGKNFAAATPMVIGLFDFIDTVKATEIYQSIHALGEGGSTLFVSAYTINDGNRGRNYVVTLNTATGTINKADATLTITPYNVPFDNRPHPAKGTAKGVLGGSLYGLDLSGTVHTAIGTYTDTWTFTDKTGDYNNASGTIVDTIFGSV